MIPLSVVALGLALWSRQNPRAAFGVASGLQIVVVFVAIATSGLAGMGSLIPMFAFHFAWASATPEPPERLVASPVSSKPWVAIGDSWKTAEATSEPTEPPTWVLHVLGVCLLALAVVWVLSVALGAT